MKQKHGSGFQVPSSPKSHNLMDVDSPPTLEGVAGRFRPMEGVWFFSFLCILLFWIFPFPEEVSADCQQMCMRGFVAFFLQEMLWFNDVKAYADNAVIGLDGCLDPPCHQAMLAQFLILKQNFNVASMSDPDSSKSFCFKTKHS